MGKVVLEKEKRNIQLSTCKCWEHPSLLQTVGSLCLCLSTCVHCTQTFSAPEAGLTHRFSWKWSGWGRLDHFLHTHTHTPHPPCMKTRQEDMLEQSTAEHGPTAAACGDTASMWLFSPWAEAGTGAPSFCSLLLDHRLGSPFWTYHQVCCTAGPAPDKAFGAETVPQRIMKTQHQPQWLNALNNWNTLRSRYSHPLLICSWDLGQFLFLKLWSHFNIFSHRTTAHVLAPVIWSLPGKQLASDVRDTCFPLFGFQQQEDDLRPWTIP